MRNRDKQDGKNKIIRNIVIVLISLVIVAVVFNISKNYINSDIKNKTNLVINNKNVTANLKKDIYIDDKGVIYISELDIKNYFDKYIEYDEKSKRLVTTSEAKVASIVLGETKMTVNNSNVNILASIIEKDGCIYVPFSEMTKIVYNVELEYIEDSNTITLDSLDRELYKANATKNVNVKSKEKSLSKTVDKIKKGENVVYISENGDWVKIRTQKGKVGYVKKNTITNIYQVRQDMEQDTTIEGKVNLVWDYFSEYAKAPDRTGTTIEGVNVVSPAFFYLNNNGKLVANVGTEGEKYIEWAHSNGYKVWPMFANNSASSDKMKLVSEILNDYDKRQELIESIIICIQKYNIDGINLDFENMYESDKDAYSRFVIELAPRLKDLGKTLSVDVTAPDGSGTWSLCFNRNVIGDVADYIVFMAYDQYGTSSKKAGTTAGYNWVETNLNKFKGQEAVATEKIILGIPFYTRSWKEVDGIVTSSTVDMKKIDIVLPESAERIWDDELKQYYTEYELNGILYKMWIEDEKSIVAKISLVHEYNLAGVAFWEKDRETEGIWSTINQELNK